MNSRFNACANSSAGYAYLTASLRQSKLEKGELLNQIKPVTNEIEGASYVSARISYMEMMMNAEGEFVLTNQQLSNIFHVTNKICDGSFKIATTSEEELVDWLYLFYGAFVFNHPAGSMHDGHFTLYVKDLCAELAEDGSAGPVQHQLYHLLTDQIALRA